MSVSEVVKDGIEVLIGRIVNGDMLPPTRTELDALLHWLAGRNVALAEVVQETFSRQKISPERAQQLTLTYLDATLFNHEADPYRLFGLMPDCDISEIKSRHKKLLQTFHPDRHRQNTEWFTNRSERINHAYAYLKSNHGKQLPPGATRPTVTPSPPGGTGISSTRDGTLGRRSTWINKDSVRRRLRDYLGSPARLEQRVYAVLLLCSLALLVALYIGSRGNVAALDTADSSVRSEFDSGNRDVASRIPERTNNPSDVWKEPSARFVAEETNHPPNTGSSRIDKNFPVEQYNSTTKQIVGGQDDKLKNFSDQGPHPEKSLTTSRLSNFEPARLAGKHDAAVSRDNRRSSSQEAKAVRNMTPETWRAPAHVKGSLPDVQQSKTIGQSEGAETSKLDSGKGIVDPTPDPTISNTETRVRKGESQSRPIKNSTQTASIERSRDESVSDIATIRELLRTYRETYMESDIQRFSDLFQRNAQTENAKGKLEIRTEYADFFERTSERNLVFEDVRIELLGNRQFKVKMQYEVSWTYLNGKTGGSNGNFIFHLVPVGDKLKIWRLSY